MSSQIPVLSYARQTADIQYRRADRTAAEKRAAAVALMRRVGIADPEQRILQYPHQFSGGMRQRAGIAMALLTDPALLIADEPTTALDVTMEAQIILLLRQLKAELDATVVVVSHNLGLIAELCDEVVVLYAGEVLERGDIHRIFATPAHPYTRALLECDPARVLPETRTAAGDRRRRAGPARRSRVGCVFAPRCVRPRRRFAASVRPAGCHAGPRPRRRVATCSAACRPMTRHRPSLRGCTSDAASRSSRRGRHRVRFRALGIRFARTGRRRAALCRGGRRRVAHGPCRARPWASSARAARARPRSRRR